MLQVNKDDLQRIFSSVLEEYGESAFRPKCQNENVFEKTCDTLHVKMTSNDSFDKRFVVKRYELLNSDGELLMRFLIGTASTLFSVSAKKFREELLSQETIRGVITLKQRIFSMTTLPAMMIFLDKGECTDTWFASVETIEQLVNYAVEDAGLLFKGYRSAQPSAESLLPEFYNGDKERIERAFVDCKTKELQDVAIVVNGKGAKPEDFADQGIPYLRARNLKDGEIVVPDVFVDATKAEQFSKQLIQEGDILLTKNFRQNKIALVTEDDCPAIASNGLFIIRPVDISDGYLYRYLTSRTGKDIFNKQLERVQKGAAIPTISMRDLAKIVVPIYDEDTMRNLEDIENLSYEDAVYTSKVLLKRMPVERDIEQKVMKDLENAGWDASLLVHQCIELGDGARLRPDFTYQIDVDRRVIVEVKRDLTSISPDWIKAVRKLLNSPENDIFILTTGLYYEVHISGIKQSLKLLRPPTLEEILIWEKGVH